MLNVLSFFFMLWNMSKRHKNSACFDAQFSELFLYLIKNLSISLWIMCRGIHIPLSSSIFFITFFILLFSSNISIVSSFCNCSRYSSSFFLYFSSTFWVFSAIDSPKSSPLCFVIIVFLIKNINYSSSPYSFANFSNSCKASGVASHSQHSSHSIQDLNDLPPQVSYSMFWAFSLSY